VPNLRVAHQTQHEQVPEGNLQKRQTDFVVARALRLVFELAGSIPKAPRYHVRSNGCDNSSNDVVDNALDAINSGDYAGLLVIQCLTSLQRVGPEGFAARGEKVAQGHCCRCEKYRCVVPLDSSEHFRTLML